MPGLLEVRTVRIWSSKIRAHRLQYRERERPRERSRKATTADSLTDRRARAHAPIAWKPSSNRRRRAASPCLPPPRVRSSYESSCAAAATRPTSSREVWPRVDTCRHCSLRTPRKRTPYGRAARRTRGWRSGAGPRAVHPHRRFGESPWRSWARSRRRSASRPARTAACGTTWYDLVQHRPSTRRSAARRLLGSPGHSHGHILRESFGFPFAPHARDSRATRS